MSSLLLSLGSLSLSSTIVIGAGGLVLTGVVLYKLLAVSQVHRQGLITANWRNDVVYLYQFPRSPYLPNMSPFCIKLETFLRHANIKYEVIGSMDHWSKEQKMPFIELNGVQYHDSDFIMTMLTDYFKLDHLEAHLTDEQKGMTRAMFKLAEQSTFETMIYNRFLENMDGFLDGLGAPINFVTRFMVSRYMKKKIGARLDHNGIGRHTRDEIYSIAKADVQAFSRLLGDKKFFFGDQPHNVDIIVWSVLTSSYYMPFDNMIRTYIVTEFTNIEAFMNRMREHFWPDWDDIVAHAKKTTAK